MSDPLPGHTPGANGRPTPGSDPKPKEASAIQRRMAELREDLRAEAAGVSQQVNEKVRQATDWKHYVHRYPLACAGLAAVAGFALVPGKKQVVQPTAEQLEELARRGKIKIKSDAAVAQRPGIAERAVLMLGAMAARAAMSYVGQRFGESAGDAATDAPSG